ncbi:MAG: sugar transferase [Clostridiales bacterium]|nr:sugar transferase [Clostridiales bacterium]
MMEEREEISWQEGAQAETAASLEASPAIEFPNTFSNKKKDAELHSRETIETQKTHKRYFYLFFKRVFDFISSLCVLIVLFLPLLAISLVVRLTSKGPVFYWDNRVGLNGKDIRVLKYRTMYEDAEEHVRDYLTDEQYQIWLVERKVEDDPRITPIGRFLRRTSIDELPQLVNILKGDISVVGPRPLTRSEIETNFTPEEQEMLLSCKPGLTGNWGVCGRSDVTFESGERQRLELEYVEKCGVLTDLKLIFATVGVVVKGKGAQ